jgi:hypothetical protein
VNQSGNPPHCGDRGPIKIPDEDRSDRRLIANRPGADSGIVGFDTSAYSVGYIAGWADGDTDLIKSTAARVLRTAHQVATILARDENEDEAADENDAASGPS